LGYGAVLDRLIPEEAHVPANLAAAAALLVAARASGVTLDELGISPARFGSGLRVGAVAAIPVVAGVAAAASFGGTRRFFADNRVSDVSSRRAAYETAVRIPVGTALGEELIFRGALLALFARERSVPRAVLASSALFGLWHVLPALRSPAAEPGGGLARRARFAAGTVAVTALAGVGFAQLRIRSRSVLAPAVVHGALNISAYVATRLLARHGTGP